MEYNGNKTYKFLFKIKSIYSIPKMRSLWFIWDFTIDFKKLKNWNINGMEKYK